MEPIAIEHLPFCPQALEFGKLSREMCRYARAIQGWANFYADQARDKQKTYEKERKTYLATEAVKNRTTTTRTKSGDLTINSSARARREKALQDLIAVGLDQSDAARIRTNLQEGK